MKIVIIVDVEDEYVDSKHPMGITNEAFEKLTGHPAPLGWLGEVQNVRRAGEEDM